MRQLVGPPGRTRREWGLIRIDLRRYLVGWLGYYRHGESSGVFNRLDRFLEERVARNIARSQPNQKRGNGRKGTRRVRMTWMDWLYQLRQEQAVPRLAELATGRFRHYRGRASVRWRAG